MNLSDLKLQDTQKSGFDLISKISMTLFASIIMLLMIVNTLKGASLTQNLGEVKSGSLLFKANGGKVAYATTLNSDISMKITGSINRVKVVQKFHNPTEYWTEGIYVFPLPTDAAVDHMSMKVGERIIVGDIKEKIEAKKIYEEAKKDGKATSLVEQERPNVFTTSVANIAPNSDIEITIEYQQSVLHKDDKFSIIYPMVVGQRYIPGKKAIGKSGSGTVLDTSIVSDASRITPPIQDPQDGLINPITINIDMDLGYTAKDMDSLYHDIYIKDVAKHKYQVSFDRKEYANKDFVLEWKIQNEPMPKAALYTQNKDGSVYGLLMVNPPKKTFIKKSYRPREVIFIVDSSGSMSGDSMKQVKEALKLALQKLKPTDRFNIIDFDSICNPLYQTAKKATYLNIRDAKRFINDLEADGGTEAYPALKYGLTSTDNTSNEFLRQVIFITDGDIGNENNMFTLIKNKLGKNRLFTVGIGSAPNRHFMKKASEFGRGSFVFIGKIEEVNQKMSVLYSKISTPAMTDIQVNFPPYLDVKLAPEVIPDLYDGDQIVVAMKLDHLPKSDISITGKIGHDDWTSNLTISQLDNTSGIDVLWARKKVADYMNIYNTNYDDNTRNGIKQVVTELGLKHHIVTKFTSLVAVDKTSIRIKEKILNTDVMKQNLPSGWNLLADEKKSLNAPKTATNSTLYLILGLVLISFAVFTLSISRRIEDGQKA